MKLETRSSERIKWKSGKAKEFFNRILSELNLKEWKELCRMLCIPKSSFSNWINEELTTPLNIIKEYLQLTNIDYKEIVPLIDQILPKYWGTFKAHKILQEKYKQKLSEWGKIGGRITVERLLGPFSPTYPKRNLNGWISKGEEELSNYLLTRHITPINTELQRKRFGVKVVKDNIITYVCFDMFLKELSSKIPTYLEFMGYRNQEYFRTKVKRFLQAVSGNPNFRVIIVTPYVELAKEFQKFPQVVKIVKFGNYKALNEVLDALSGP